ncbi:MAG: sigma-70 family RNA polymerase sigma factor [Elusimicrobiaceae bacterium]|nr:sigma-70 family RNA polymerase sigma factor [Elusimicrobiaceae bacterium]
MTDAELVRLVRCGDGAAFEALMTRYKGPVYGYILSLVHSEDVAGDIFQEVFIKVFKNIGGYREEGKFGAWVYRMASNLAMDHFRRSGRLGAKEIALDGEDAETELHSVIASSEQTPEQRLAGLEDVVRVRAALDRLPPEQKEVVMLKEFSGMTFQEIADSLQVPLGTVLARGSRAIKKLRTMLESENEPM